MDFINDLPLVNRFDSVLVMVDHFTKMVHFALYARTLLREETMDLFLKNVIQLHELFDQITSKGVSQFVSHFLRCLLQTFDTLVNLSLAYHPQTNGQTKWGNQILEQYFWCYINSQKDDWVDLLPMVEFAYNNSLHGSTEVTPSKLWLTPSLQHFHPLQLCKPFGKRTSL